MERNAGFTLFDLIVTVAVVAVLSVTAVPAFGRLLLDGQMTARVNALVHGVHLAKQSAHVRLADIVLCKSGDGHRCVHDGDWHDGWIVFVNVDEDHPPQHAEDEPILTAGGAWPHGAITANRDVFIFRAATTRSTNGTLVFCDRRGPEAARALIISYTGRPRISRRAPGKRPLLC